MSLSKLWLSLGFIIAFAYGNLLCQKVKIYIFITLLVVGMAMYGYLEYEWRKLKKIEKMSIEAEMQNNGTLQIEKNRYIAENKGYIDDNDVKVHVDSNG